MSEPTTATLLHAKHARSRAASAPDPAGVPAFLRIWIPYFLLFAVLMTLWGMATPLAASPDEPAQILRAASVVRGQFLGPTTRGPEPGSAYTKVTVPRTYAQVQNIPACYAFKPTVTARCIPKIVPSSKPTSVPDYMGRYPPLYYLIVGIPSLFTDQLLGVHLMRWASALLNAGFLALAFATARRWSSSTVLPAGIAIAATPMCLFLAGTVNASSLEITSAIAAWTAAVVFVTDHIDRPPVGLVAALGVSSATLALARGDTPLWLVVITVAAAPIWVGRLHFRLLARRYIALWAAVVGAASLAAMAWIIGAHALRIIPSPVPKHHSVWDAISVMFGTFPELVRQEIGVFGWLDTPSPWATRMLWFLVAGGALTIGVMVGRVRHLLSMALTLAATVSIPLLIAAVTYSHDGYYEQGRYFLPIAVGIPIVALANVRTNTHSTTSARRVLTFFGAAVALAQFLAFYFALRRYRVGVNGPIVGSGSLPPSQIWVPPLGTIPLEAFFLAAYVATVVMLQRDRERPAGLHAGQALRPLNEG